MSQQLKDDIFHQPHSAVRGPVVWRMALEHLQQTLLYMGVSENSVALNPLVNDHYPY